MSEDGNISGIDSATLPENKPLVELPLSILGALRDLVNQLPDDDVIKYAKGNPTFRKGSFQPVKKNAGYFREKMKTHIKSPFEPSQALHTLLSKADLGSSFLAVLSFEAIERGLESFMAYYGFARFVANLLVNEREDVRNIGLEQLSGAEVKNDMLSGRAEAASEIRIVFGPFLEHIAEVLADGQKEVPDPKDNLRRKEREEDYKENKKQLQKLQTEAHKKQERISELERRCDELKNQAQKEKQENEKTQVGVKVLEGKLVTLTGEVEEKVREAFTSGQRDGTRFWLDRPRQVEDAIRDDEIRKSHKNILESVKKALHKQTQRDRHFGNIVELQKRLQDLMKARDSINVAQKDALSPLPELTELKNELDAEIERIRELLGFDRDVSSTYSTFVASINGLMDPDKLARLRDFLSEPLNQLVWSSRELTGLYEACYRKMDQLYYAHGMPEKFLESDTWWSAWKLRDAVRRKDHFLLIVDGHNVIKIIEEKKINPDFPYGGSHRERREWLAARVEDLVSGQAGCEATVYFDGDIYSEIGWSTDVKVIYSGGKGEHRADKVILEYLEFCNIQSDKRQKALVTNDDDLSLEAGILHTMVMPVEELAALFACHSERQSRT